jgi:hypothetical protein
MTIKLRLDRIYFFNDIQIGMRNSVLPTVLYELVIFTRYTFVLKIPDDVSS